MLSKTLIILLVTLTSISQTSNPQDVMKLRAYNFSYKVYNENTRTWSDWSADVTCNILIVWDFDKARFTFYSQSMDEYDIVKYYGKSVDADGDEIMKMLCVDKNGRRCYIRQMRQLTGKTQVYIDYSNIIYVYDTKLND